MASNACVFEILPPTAVNISLCGNFTGPSSTDLIIVKYTKIELHTLKGSRLMFVEEMEVHGKIVAACLFVLSGEDKSLLFLLSSKCEVAIVEYKNNAFVTLDTDKVHDFSFRMAESGSLLRWSPEHQLFSLRFGDELLNLVTWDRNRHFFTFSYRFIEMHLIDVTFLHSCQKPTIAYVYENSYGCHVETLVCDKAKGTISEGLQKWICIELDASMMFPIPKPLNGLIVIGQESVIFAHESTTFSIMPECTFTPGLFCCYGVIESGKMYVIGDTQGRIYSLSVNAAMGFDGLKVKYICEVARPETLTYLGNGILFVGSRVSDSVLVRIPALYGDTTNSFAVLGNYPCLAPIADVTLFPTAAAAGAPSALTCSGYGKDGSLRLIRAGIDCRELAHIPIAEVIRAWLVNASSGPAESLLIISFVFGTRTYTISNGQVEEVEIAAIPSCERTRLAMNQHFNGSNRLIVVSTDAVRMIDMCQDGKLLSEWSPLEHKRIDVAAGNANSGHLVICCGGYLCLLGCDHGHLSPIAERTFPNDISCADISDLGGTSDEVAAVGQWLEDSVILFNPVNMITLGKYPTQGVARSLQFCRMENASRLFISTSDRHVVSLLLADQQGDEYKAEKTFVESTDCPTLKSLKIGDKTVIFGCCTRPFILLQKKDRLRITRVILGPTSCISTVDTDAFPGDSFLLCLKDKLCISTFGELTNIHFRNVPVGETPARICHQVETRTFAVCTEKEVPVSAAKVQICEPPSVSNSAKVQLVATPFPKHVIKAEVQVHSREDAKKQNHFLVFDQESCEALVCYKMSPNEKCCSVLSCQLANDPNVYYIVGTALIIRSQKEASVGRLMVFRVRRDLETPKSNRDFGLDLVHEKTINGAPYAMIEFNRKLLVSIGKVVLLFEWVLRNKKHSLQLECSCSCRVCMIQLLQLSPSSVLCGDFKQSLILFTYKPAESTLESRDLECHAASLTAIAATAPDFFLSTDVECNLHAAEMTEEHTVRHHRFHLGQYVNVFCRSIGDLAVTCEIARGAPALYATAEGSLGTVCVITPRYFTLFKALEMTILKECPNYGIFDHSSWRRAAEVRWDSDTSSSPNIVDGNVIAHMLDLPAELKNSILRESVNIANGLLADSGFSFDCDAVECVVEDMFALVFS